MVCKLKPTFRSYLQPSTNPNVPVVNHAYVISLKYEESFILRFIFIIPGTVYGRVFNCLKVSGHTCTTRCNINRFWISPATPTPHNIKQFVLLIATCYLWKAHEAQVVQALRYKPEGRGFDFRRRHGNLKTIPVAERSKARVCSRSSAGIAGSNPAGRIDISVVCCKYRQKDDKRTSTDEVQSTTKQKNSQCGPSDFH